VRRYGWDWPQLLDPRREQARKLGAEYQPHVVAIDAEGRIVGRLQGLGSEASWEALAAKLR
jgi:hypothetical protein